MRSSDRWRYVYLVQDREVDRHTVRELARVEAERGTLSRRREWLKVSTHDTRHTTHEIDFARVERLVKGAPMDWPDSWGSEE